MTVLFVAAGACSFGAHVAVKEFNLPVEVSIVPLRDAASIIFKINPLGRVPSLVVNDRLITENVAVLAWLGDLSENYVAYGAPHTVARAHINSWLSFFSSEVHAGAFRLINRAKTWSQDPTAQSEFSRIGAQQLAAAFAHIDAALGDNDWLVENRFTVADAYLGVFLNWSLRLPNFLENFPALSKYLERYNTRASVKQAKAIETDWLENRTASLVSA